MLQSNRTPSILRLPHSQPIYAKTAVARSITGTNIRVHRQNVSNRNPRSSGDSRLVQCESSIITNAAIIGIAPMTLALPNNGIIAHSATKTHVKNKAISANGLTSPFSPTFEKRDSLIILNTFSVESR